MKITVAAGDEYTEMLLIDHIEKARSSWRNEYIRIQKDNALIIGKQIKYLELFIIENSLKFIGKTWRKPNEV
ncbi:hypothetical protein BM449_11470 [Synechococcus sp. SynAce01]|nr:hypothetical protein BM449_11470 [Synechococcus sp. SynAce01]